VWKPDRGPPGKPRRRWKNLKWTFRKQNGPRGLDLFDSRAGHVMEHCKQDNQLMRIGPCIILIFE